MRSGASSVKDLENNKAQRVGPSLEGPLTEGRRSVGGRAPFGADPFTFPRRLIDGYRIFATQRLPREQSRYQELSERGQAPEVMVIGCCDSRVSPDVIFDAGPGEVFVVRNVANLVLPYAPEEAIRGVAAALEFAIQILHIKHIVVLGHAQCGGVRAAVQATMSPSPGDFIGRWVLPLVPVVQETMRQSDEPQHAFITRLEKRAILRSLENLMTYPTVRDLVERERLRLHGAYFGVATGSLSLLNAATGEFNVVSPEQVPFV